MREWINEGKNNTIRKIFPGIETCSGLDERVLSV
jgi:hypothetical protein